MEITSSAYHFIIVETYTNLDAKRGKDSVRVRPISGQTLFPIHLNVECSRAIREKYPIGTQFRIKAKLSVMKGKTYVYSSHNWPYQII
jgi:hypothetical protein